MSSTLEFQEIWLRCLANKDSTELENLLTDDFERVNRHATMNKQETLDWTTTGGPSPHMDSIEMLYENDDVGVGTLTGQSNNGKSLQMFFARKRGEQFCQWVLVRQPM